MMNQKKVVIAGPPHSGKSVIRDGLRSAIMSITRDPYPYFITANPDGEGCWYQETVRNDPERAQKYKSMYKGVFSPEFVEIKEESVELCPEPLTLVDIGGKPSPENEQICRPATHIVIISGDKNTFQEWRDFAGKTNLTIVAEIYSDYQGKADVIIGVDESGILRGSVHHLERGEDVSERPFVIALAEHLLKL